MNGPRLSRLSEAEEGEEKGGGNVEICSIGLAGGQNAEAGSNSNSNISNSRKRQGEMYFTLRRRWVHKELRG